MPETLYLISRDRLALRLGRTPRIDRQDPWQAQRLTRAGGVSALLRGAANALRKGAAMRIASFNVENLFERARALDLPTFEEGRQTLQEHAEINALINKAVYTAADKQRMI